MTPTHKERLLADILAALLRIEAKLDTAKVADSEVDAVEYYRKLLEDKAKAKRPPPSWPTVPAENWSLEAVHPACRKCIGKPCGNSACPSRPVITCGSPTVTVSVTPSSTKLPPGTYVAPTAALPGMPDPPIAPVRPQTVWSSLPTSCADKANAPSLNQGRFMHGGWIHATGFSMVGP